MNKMMDRRRMLATLGLAVGAAYVAPSMLSLSEARASGGSAGSRSAASPASAPSQASPASAPSRASMPSRASTPSAPSAASRSSFSRPSADSSAAARKRAETCSFSDPRQRDPSCPPVKGENPFLRLLRMGS